MKKLYEAEICKFESKEITYDGCNRYKFDRGSQKNIVGTIEDDTFIDNITGEEYPIFKKVGYYTQNAETIEIDKYYAWVKEFDKQSLRVFLTQIKKWVLSQIENQRNSIQKVKK